MQACYGSGAATPLTALTPATVSVHDTVRWVVRPATVAVASAFSSKVRIARLSFMHHHRHRHQNSGSTGYQ